MRVSSIVKCLGVAACALTVVPAQRLSAQTPLTIGTWTHFSWFGGLGEVDDEGYGGFTFTSLLQTRVRVTDAFFAGDAFDIFLNGAPDPAYSTPIVSFSNASEPNNGPDAFADPLMSKIEFLLDPGSYTLNIFVTENGGFTDNSLQYGGEGFLLVDEIPAITGTPEPGTVVLLGAGLAAAALARRRKRIPRD